MKTETCDVAVIGAGPAGSVASAMLAQRGWDVRVVERQRFPRFSIGESLLPQCVEFIREAGLFDVVERHGFQFKDGAAFQWADRKASIYFPEKSTPGWGTAWQVQRAVFDKLLIDGAVAKGVRASFGDTVTAFDSDDRLARLTVADEVGDERRIEARFVLDASGFGRVLPRLLGLEASSGMAARRSVFRHVTDNIDDAAFDRDKILISIHPSDSRIWYWLIPLAEGVSSIGVVGEDAVIEGCGGTPDERLDHFVGQSGWMAELLAKSVSLRPAAEIVGYSANVTSLVGERFALLGNAAEFLDPVFSSGVTIAMKSANLAAKALDRELRGEEVDWNADFAEELQYGVDAFRACVNAWYDGPLQRIIFHKEVDGNEVTKCVTAILAGYAWDRENPIVREPERFLNLVDRIIAA